MAAQRRPIGAVRDGAPLAGGSPKGVVSRFRSGTQLLFAHFLARACERLDGPPPVVDDKVRWRLRNHTWPGNVRELSHYAQRVALGLADESGIGPTTELAPLPERVAPYEARVIEETLAANAGDIRSTLEVLRIPSKTFYNKVERHGIDLTRHRRK